MKNMNISRTLLLSISAFLFMFCVAFDLRSGGDWEVPDKYKNMKNPVEADAESLNIGKSIYSKHCKSCHGKYGEGDGSKVAELESEVGDFTDGSLDDQSDGTLFYKTLEGKDEMPAFKKKIRYEEDIWHVVNYLRELSEG